MKARGPIALLCASLLATGLAACGSTVATSGFKGEQHAVAQAVSNLQSHATALEAKKVCGEDLASVVVARLDTAAGGCKQAIESQLKQIDSFETTVESVRISGDRATAQVKGTRSGKKALQTLTFVKEAGKWKVSGVS
jgi:copper chaperone CopZ